MAVSNKIALLTTEKYHLPQHTLVAKECIQPGETVWWVSDDEKQETFSRDEILSASPKIRQTLTKFSFMLDDDLYGSTTNPEDDIANYFNHSCDPNCGYDRDHRLIALRTIHPGEDVHYDYSMTETEASFHAGLECLCGSNSCRGVLSFHEWRSPNFVRRYRGLLSPYIAHKSRQLSWNDPRVYVKSLQSNQLGLFSLGPILKGEVVLVFAGKVVGLEELSALSDRDRVLSLQVHESLWQVPIYHSKVREPGDYINHSCEANCGMQDSTTLVAIEDIPANSEITLDYGTVNSGAIGEEASDNFDCRCGKECCRGRVSSQDWRLKEVQTRYWPHFPPFMRQLIQNSMTVV